jgi:DNA polymerase delta subunit 1
MHNSSSPLSRYETKIPYVLRFMIDSEMQGGAWLELPAKKFVVRGAAESRSHCQMEMDIHYTDLVVHQPEGDWMKIAPVRVLSFDIECAGRKGHFPDADIDPVIQIANVVMTQGSSADKPIIKNVFTLKSCAAISGSQVLAHEDEESSRYRILTPGHVTPFHVVVRIVVRIPP